MKASTILIAWTVGVVMGQLLYHYVLLTDHSLLFKLAGCIATIVIAIIVAFIGKAAYDRWRT